MSILSDCQRCRFMECQQTPYPCGCYCHWGQAGAWRGKQYMPPWYYTLEAPVFRLIFRGGWYVPGRWALPLVIGAVFLLCTLYILMAP